LERNVNRKIGLGRVADMRFGVLGYPDKIGGRHSLAEGNIRKDLNQGLCIQPFGKIDLST
jgi:hypothetical protein